jgi:outer membrane protein
MKRLNVIFLLLLLLAAPATLAAQDKFGYVNTQELIVILPEYKIAEDSLKAYAGLLQADYMQLQEEYNTLFSKFERLIDDKTLSLEDRQKDYIDIQNLDKRMQQLEQGSEQLLTNKQEELLKPVTAVLNEAIKSVAKDNGYTYVIDSSAFGIFTVVPEADDITPLVLQRLGGYWVPESK